MEKKEISIFSQPEELDKSKWEMIINNPVILELMKKVNIIADTEINTIEDYEEQQSKILSIQKEVNKYNDTYVKPIKRWINDFKNQVVLKQEKQTVDFIKNLKKAKKQEAIDKGIIFEEIEVEKPKEENELQKIINTELEWLQKHKNETRSNEYLQMIFMKINKIIKEEK